MKTKLLWLLFLALALLFTLGAAIFKLNSFELEVKSTPEGIYNDIVDHTSGEKLDSINIKFDGKSINVGKIISRYCRFYIPLGSFVRAAGGTITQDGNNLKVSLGKSASFNTSDNTANGKGLLHEAIKSDGEYYVSLYDLSNSLSLFCDWDNPTKSISLISGAKARTKGPQKKGTRPALVRLEDITPLGDDTSTDDDLFKQRIIADFLYSEGIPFGVALVPRYVNPEKGYDNDPTRDYSFYNAEFVYTLDYYMGRGATIGLHGYTHQYGDTKSLFGKEFGPDLNNTKEETRARIESAIDCAKKLELKVGFFEFPHYIYTPLQMKVAERYFDCFYHSPSKKVTYARRGLRKIKMVPTPLQYLDLQTDVDAKIEEIKNADDRTLLSLFFHPIIEYGSISVSRESLMPNVFYSSGSPLHRIISAIYEKGGRFVSIKEIK